MPGGQKNNVMQAARTHAVGGLVHGQMRTTAYAWVHGPTENWNRRRSIRQAHRAQASDWCANPHRFGCIAHARDRARAGRHGSCAGRAEGLGQSWQGILDGLVDWRSASSVRVARRSADGSAVSELPDDLRSGTLAWQRCHDPLVHESERSDRYSSSGQTDRADGRAMHRLVVDARVQSERSCQVGSGRDKGGK